MVVAIAALLLSVPLLDGLLPPARPSGGRQAPRPASVVSEPLASFSSRSEPKILSQSAGSAIPVIEGDLASAPTAAKGLAAVDSEALRQGPPAPSADLGPPERGPPLLAFEPPPPLEDDGSQDPVLPFEEAAQAELEPVVPPKAPSAAILAALPPRARAGAVVAIVIDDLGNSHQAVERAIRLPPPVTLAFLPLEGVAELARRGAVAGHDIFLHMPMQPVGHENPGPLALLESASPDELRRRLALALDRVPMAVGVNNHMGSRLTSDPTAMQVVLADLQERGLAFVDSRTSGSSVAAGIGLALGVGVAGRDIFLDNDPDYGAVLRQLEQTERLARRAGSALAIGHPYPGTLQALADFLPAARARGITLVSATRLIILRGCAAATSPRTACDLRGHGILASRGG